MKKIDECTKTELKTIGKIVQIKGRSKMNKAELYESITKYFKTEYKYDESFSFYFEDCHIRGYCEKWVLNPIVKLFKNNPFRIVELSQINSIENREYNMEQVKELSFFLNDSVYHICDNEEYAFLVLETEKYYGFIAPIVPFEEDEEEEFELSLVNTKDEYNRVKNNGKNN